MGGLFQINPVTKTGQRLYMVRTLASVHCSSLVLQVHMLLLPFLPITALIIQNSTTLNELLQYQTEVQRIGDKVSTVQYSTVQYSTVQYSTRQRSRGSATRCPVIFTEVLETKVK